MPHVRGRPPRNSIAASRYQDPKGRSSVCWYRRALASRKMQNFVAHLRANPLYQADAEFQRRPMCPFSPVSINHRLPCRRHSGVHPQILASKRSHLACRAKKIFSGNGDCAVAREIRAPGVVGRRVLSCEAIAALRIPEQAKVCLDPRQDPPEGCFVSKIADLHEPCFLAASARCRPFCRFDSVNIGWRELARTTQRFFLQATPAEQLEVRINGLVHAGSAPSGSCVDS